MRFTDRWGVLVVRPLFVKVRLVLVVVEGKVIEVPGWERWIAGHRNEIDGGIAVIAAAAAARPGRITGVEFRNELVEHIARAQTVDRRDNHRSCVTQSVAVLSGTREKYIYSLSLSLSLSHSLSQTLNADPPSPHIHTLHISARVCKATKHSVGSVALITDEKGNTQAPQREKGVFGWWRRHA